MRTRQPGIIRAPAVTARPQRIPAAARADGCAEIFVTWTALATEENTLLALEPISRMVPTTITRMTASITAYSAMSWPESSRHKLIAFALICCPP